MGWKIVLCSCNETLDWDAPAIQRALDLADRPVVYHRLPRDEIHRFMDLVSQGGFDGLVVGCCGPEGLFREAAGAAGGDSARVVVRSFKESCFWPHAERAAANTKAARLLRAAIRAAESARLQPELPVKVGPTVLIAADSPAGLELARRLGEVGKPVLVLDERSAAFDREFIYPLPWQVNWGSVVKVDGSLGNFRVTVVRDQPLNLQTCVYCQRCVPVCHTSAISQGLRLRMELCDRCGDCLKACEHVGAIKIPRHDTEVLRADQVVVISGNGAPEVSPRTGYHLLTNSSAGGVDTLAWKVFGLIGDFQRPQYVLYDAETCAGGAADHEACGLCITACPYHAISRSPKNPLRVQVDPHACEGCGACVAACPTSSLTFTDPPPADVSVRLRALLAPLPGRPDMHSVIAFHCPEKGAAALAEAGRLRVPYPASVLPVSMACLRHVSEANMLTAFRVGAAGVALVGCESCPHGERELVFQKLEVTKAVLDAFGLGAERVHLITGEGREIIEALDHFARSLDRSPVSWDGQEGEGAAGNRESIADAIDVLLGATGREPGRIRVPPSAAFAFPDVRAGGCTVCRSCVNVCPTHAFRYVEESQALELKQIDCVNCGLCVTVCPESVITLKNELYLDCGALAYQVVVQDETLHCAQCNVPFANKRAVEVVEATVFGMADLLDTFAGERRDLLRMCPNCRAVSAMQEMEKGWEP
ncbi:MAG: 4Fe-4S dicluster domain-containing protein [Candidatus Methylomirabilia bacterium]